MSKPKPQVTQLPQEMTQTVQDTPDIQNYRNWDPTAAVYARRGEIDAPFDRGERQIREQFGGMSGIRNPIAKARSTASALDDLSYNRAMANAAMNAEALGQTGAQKAYLADLTATRKQSGYTSQVTGGGANPYISGGISAGGAIISAAII